jgi:hypothetical protein
VGQCRDSRFDNPAFFGSAFTIEVHVKAAGQLEPRSAERAVATTPAKRTGDVVPILDRFTFSRCDHRFLEVEFPSTEFIHGLDGAILTLEQPVKFGWRKLNDVLARVLQLTLCVLQFALIGQQSLFDCVENLVTTFDVSGVYHH